MYINNKAFSRAAIINGKGGWGGGDFQSIAILDVEKINLTAVEIIFRYRKRIHKLYMCVYIYIYIYSLFPIFSDSFPLSPSRLKTIN